MQINNNIDRNNDTINHIDTDDHHNNNTNTTIDNSRSDN